MTKLTINAAARFLPMGFVVWWNLSVIGTFLSGIFDKTVLNTQISALADGNIFSGGEGDFISDDI